MKATGSRGILGRPTLGDIDRRRQNSLKPWRCQLPCAAQDGAAARDRPTYKAAQGSDPTLCPRPAERIGGRIGRLTLPIRWTMLVGSEPLACTVEKGPQCKEIA